MAIFIAFLTLALCAQGTVYLFSGADSFGNGLSYPSSPILLRNDSNSSVISVDMNNTTQIYGLMGPMSTPFSSFQSGYAPSGILYIFPQMSPIYKGDVPALDEFAMPDWQPDPLESEIRDLNKFLEDDWNPEPLSTGDYSSPSGFHSNIVGFLKDDNIPGRPLL